MRSTLEPDEEKGGGPGSQERRAAQEAAQRGAFVKRVALVNGVERHRIVTSGTESLPEEDLHA